MPFIVRNFSLITSQKGAILYAHWNNLEEGMLFPPFNYLNRDISLDMVSVAIEKTTEPFFGYQLDPAIGKFIKVDDEANCVKDIYKHLVEEQQPIYILAEKIDEKYHHLTEFKFNAYMLLRIIRNPAYCGFTYDHSGFLKKSTLYTDPIVDMTLWQKAVTIVNYRRFEGHGSKKQLEFPLSGFIKCAICNTDFYRKKRDYSKNSKRTGLLSPYYQHSRTNHECNNSTYLNAELIERISIIIMIDMLVSKKYRADLIKDFNYYQNYLRSWAVQEITEDLIFLDLSDPYRFITNRLFISPFDKGTGEQVDTLFEEINQSNTILIGEFNKYIEETFQAIVAKKSPTYFNAVRSLFEEITVYNNRIAFLLGTQQTVIINPHKLTLELKQKINAHISKKLFGGDLEIFQKVLDELIPFLEYKTTQQYYADESIIIQGANQLQLTFFEKYKTPYKHYYERADFININDTEDTINGVLPYQMNHAGGIYIDSKGERLSTNTVYDSKTVLSIMVSGKNYINSRYIHRLPEWFYGANFEYFKVGKERIAFIIEDEKVKAYKLPTRGVRKEIGIEEALSLLKSQTEFDYRDID
jgi:hypothetical protein